VSRWEVFAALPNITLPDPSRSNLPLSAEVRDVAIVHGDDQRVLDARSQSPAVNRLMSGFRTHNDQAYTPSAIICRSSATVTGAAVISFRNAIALTSVLRSWATEHNNDALIYTDWFDIFPAYETKAGHLIIMTPATKSLFATGSKFLATPSPLGRLRPNYLAQDYYLTRALTARWCRSYQENRDDHFSRALFRSLEIAYTAAAAPMRSNATEYEWGNNLALWVSAIEVLAHPRSAHVSQAEALRLLGTYRWGSKKLDAPRRLIWPEGRKKASVQVNAIQSAYHFLYKARNAYLHGNKVLKSTMRPFKRARGTTLVMIAPLIYRTALFAYLQRKVRPYQGLTNAEWRNARAAPHLMPMVGERMRVNMALSRMLWPSKQAE